MDEVQFMNMMQMETWQEQQLYQLPLVTEQDVFDACFEYIDGFYSTTWIHESLGYKTPNQFGRELLENEYVANGEIQKKGIISYDRTIREFAKKNSLKSGLETSHSIYPKAKFWTKII